MAVSLSPFGWCICAPGASAGKIETARDADVLHGGVNGRGIDGGRLVARQSKQHGAVGSVAQAGERQRAVQIHLNAGNAVQQSRWRKVARKAAGGLHGTHGV
jgi:hypothetical protein